MKHSANKKDFHDFVIYDLLAEFDSISSKPMFGGWGIYRNGAIFAIVSSGELFLKASNPSAEKFFKAQTESKQFSYTRSGREEPVRLRYWSVPAEVLEDPDLFNDWAEKAMWG